ncbi:hypothetical protein STCU_10415 [Strigomonas culicis]|uniref:protein-serine/threonine phosphatase n=1 Tax=Strigomonas culicis TaxID=28005 RepID=S9TMZ7_9TRYP|nr:hypothetical protein STCU_10415 [Strigomonas culicis]|eukprot:EPY17758.1 hypothetical protein STCU_10415 [Strigomonas culicis]
MLALSRAIGDFSFKTNTQVPWDQQAVTSAPEVRTTHINRDKDEFVVVACDGIWDMMSNEQVVEFVRHRIQQRIPLGEICEQLMETCVSPVPFGVGCDNMSVIIVQFKRQPPVRKAPSPLAALGGTEVERNASSVASSTDKKDGSTHEVSDVEKSLDAAEDTSTLLFRTAVAAAQLRGKDTLASPIEDDAPAVFPEKPTSHSFCSSELDQLRSYVSSTHTT